MSAIGAAQQFIDEGLAVMSVAVAWCREMSKKVVRPRVKAWTELTLQTCRQKLDPLSNGVGVLTGEVNDLLVIDVDHPAAEVFKALEDKHGLPPCPRVNTPSGGWHLWFSLSQSRRQGLHNTTSRARLSFGELGAISVDVRCDGGMVISPPSHYDRDGLRVAYVWGVPRDGLWPPPAAPEWIISALNAETAGPKIRRPVRSFPPSDGMLPAGPKHSWRESEGVLCELREMLRKLGDTTSRYSQSVQLRTCISHNFRNSPTRECPYGVQHSKNNFALQERGLQVTYKCFSSECAGEHPVFVGVLPARIMFSEGSERCRFHASAVKDLSAHMRARVGVVGAPGGAPGGDEFGTCLRREILEYMNTYFLLVREPRASIAEIIYTNDRCNRVRRILMRSERELKLLLANVYVPAATADGKVKAADEFFKKQGSRREVDCIDFLPDSPEVVVATSKGRTLNTFPGFLIEYEEDFVVDGAEIELLLYHIKEVLVAGDANHSEWFLDFLADILQHPGQKSRVAVVLRGEQGPRAYNPITVTCSNSFKSPASSSVQPQPGPSPM